MSNLSQVMTGFLGPRSCVLDRHSVFFGPFLHDPDDILYLGVTCASQ